MFLKRMGAVTFPQSEIISHLNLAFFQQHHSNDFHETGDDELRMSQKIETQQLVECWESSDDRRRILPTTTQNEHHYDEDDNKKECPLDVATEIMNVHLNKM